MISIGLVNVPVKLYTMIKDQSFSFKFVRREDACPLKNERVYTLDKEVVPWSDIGRAVEVRKGEFVLAGQRVKGRYELVRFDSAGENEWLLFRKKA